MSNHLAGGKVNIAQIQELARNDLLKLIEQCDGTKVRCFIYFTFV